VLRLSSVKSAAARFVEDRNRTWMTKGCKKRLKACRKGVPNFGLGNEERIGSLPVRRWDGPRPETDSERKDTMDQNTFVRRTTTLLNRRSLCGGASAMLLSIAGLPLAAQAEKQHTLERRKETNMTVTTLPMARLAIAAANDQIAAFRGRLLGRLITPDDPDYDEARSTLYFTMDRRPRAIVRVADADDVAEAVSFAREHDLPLAVRSGGHSVAYQSVVDDALVVDFSEMKRVRLDAKSRTARVQPGATTADLAGPANANGLALTSGDTQSVGFGGLTTGGGIGFMVRKYGLTIDNLLSAQVVTAAGEIVTASADEHPDLFWAIRGGGGNFGIVTEFTYRLAPVDQILGGELILPATREVLRGYLDYVATAPDELSTIGNVMYSPPAPHVPAEQVGKLGLSVLVCWSGDQQAGEDAVAPLRALGTPLADAIAPMPYPDIYRFTAHQAEPHAASIRMMFADDLSDDTLDAALAAMQNASSPFSLVQFRGLGGAMARVPEEATAFAHRQRRYWLAVIGLWLDPGEDGSPHQAWTAALWENVRHEGRGVYVNFLEEEGPERIHEAYPPATYARLAEIKRTYDPENLFHFNQNVPPQ
jgi:FAD/FMN-containing dehydrogenase